MKENIRNTFEVYSFIQNFFQDLSLTLPSLGCKFTGTVTPSDIIAETDLNQLKNKLFLLFIDIAGEEKDLDFKFTLSSRGNKLHFCFTPNTPLHALSNPYHFPNWDSSVFQVYTCGDGMVGFAVEADFAPDAPESRIPFEKQKLYEAYGDRTTAKNLAIAFAKRADFLITNLEVAVQDNQVDETLRLAHTLKGAARSIFALPLSKKAHLLEMKARDKNLDGALELYKNIVEAYHEFKTFFDKETL